MLSPIIAYALIRGKTMRATSIAILAGMFITVMVIIGVAGGRWAHRQSEICEQQYQSVIDVIRGAK